MADASRQRAIYGADLAAIQTAAFGDHVADAAPGLLRRLRDAGIDGGRVVDLGCGAGDWLAHLADAGYEAVGVEPSAPLRAHARARAPAAAVIAGTAATAELDGAVAVTALGEVFNYLPVEGRAVPLARQLRRVAAALPRGGLLLFDLIVEGRPSLDANSFFEGHLPDGSGWLLAVEMREDVRRARGERRIRVFRELAGGWRHSEERHRIRIPATSSVLAALREAGFAARVARSWHEAPLRPRRRAFIARKR